MKECTIQPIRTTNRISPPCFDESSDEGGRLFHRCRHTVRPVVLPRRCCPPSSVVTGVRRSDDVFIKAEKLENESVGVVRTVRRIFYKKKHNLWPRTMTGHLGLPLLFCPPLSSYCMTSCRSLPGH